MSSYGYPGAEGPPTYARDRFWSSPPNGGGTDPWNSSAYTPQLELTNFPNSNYIPYGASPQSNGAASNGSSGSGGDLAFSGPSPPNPNQLQPISYPPQSPSCGSSGRGGGGGQYTPSSTPTPGSNGNGGNGKINGINGTGSHSSNNSNSGSPPGRQFGGYLEDQSQPPSGLPNGNGHSNSSNASTLLNLGGKSDMMNGGGDPYRGQGQGQGGQGQGQGHGDPYSQYNQNYYQPHGGYQHQQGPPTSQPQHQGYHHHYYGQGQGQGQGQEGQGQGAYKGPYDHPYHHGQNQMYPGNYPDSDPYSHSHSTFHPLGQGQGSTSPEVKGQVQSQGQPEHKINVSNDKIYDNPPNSSYHPDRFPDLSQSRVSPNSNSNSNSNSSLNYSTPHFPGGSGSPPKSEPLPPPENITKRKNSTGGDNPPPAKVPKNSETPSKKEKGRKGQGQGQGNQNNNNNVEEPDLKKGGSKEEKPKEKKRRKKRTPKAEKEKAELKEKADTPPKKESSKSPPSLGQGGQAQGQGQALKDFEVKVKVKEEVKKEELEDLEDLNSGEFPGDEDEKKGDVQMVECGCFPADEVHAEPGPFYTHLGAAHDLVELRKLVEARTGFRGNQVRLEKVIYTGKEGKSSVGCPIAKWILRRGSAEEQLLFLVKHRKGHKCSTAWIVVCCVIWEGVPPHFSDNLYDTLVYKLNRFGIPTTRRSDTNEQRSCACQGVDPDTCGGAYSFGCAWSMFFNGCKYARSRNVRKFRLTEEHEESELEEKVQHLATHLAPLYERVAPDSYTNQIDHENEGLECRLGFRPGRPFSGVTACLDYCSHAHKDAHNMMNGCTVTVSLTRHRTLSRPDDEQYHVLPLYKLDDTDEHGSKEGQKAKVKKGQLEILKKFPCKVRIRKVPLLPSRRRAKAKAAGSQVKEPAAPPPPSSGGSKGQGQGPGEFGEISKREKMFDERLPPLPVPVPNGTMGEQFGGERFHPGYGQGSSIGHNFNEMGASSSSTPNSLWNHFNPSPNSSNSSRGQQGPSNSYFDPSPPTSFSGPSSSLTSLTELTNSTISRHGSSSNLASGPSSTSSTILSSPGSSGNPGSASSGYSSMSPILPSFRNTFMSESDSLLGGSPDPTAASSPRSGNLGLNLKPQDHYPGSGPGPGPSPGGPGSGYHGPGGYGSAGGSSTLYHPQPHNPCLPHPHPYSPYSHGPEPPSYGSNFVPWGSGGPGGPSYSNYGYGSYPSSAGFGPIPPPPLNPMGGGYSPYGMSQNVSSMQRGNSWGPGGPLGPFTPPGMMNVNMNMNMNMNAMSMNMGLNPSGPGHGHGHGPPGQGQGQGQIPPGPPAGCFVSPPKPKVIPEVSETSSDNEDCFKDPQMGGVAIALTHGSVILQCAKHEMHATTALKNPNRMYPSRICLIFYQHKSMNNRFHGWSEWEKKIEAKKLQEVKLINQGKMEASPRKMKQLIKEGYIQDSG